VNRPLFAVAAWVHAWQLDQAPHDSSLIEANASSNLVRELTAATKVYVGQVVIG